MVHTSNYSRERPAAGGKVGEISFPYSTMVIPQQGGFRLISKNTREPT
jgi:hypothetical protein